MRPSQIVLSFFILSAFVLTILKYRRGKIKLLELIFWSLLWLAAVVLIVLPDTMSFLADMLGIGRGVDAVIYLSVILSFYMIFRLYEKMDQIEREITEIVRHLALEEKDRSSAGGKAV
jgi:hypothetical protein